MRLYGLGFTLFIVAFIILGFSVGRETCACGDLPQPDETINQIKIPTI
jgi:hypothetical protein